MTATTMAAEMAEQSAGLRDPTPASVWSPSPTEQHGTRFSQSLFKVYQDCTVLSMGLENSNQTLTMF